MVIQDASRVRAEELFRRHAPFVAAFAARLGVPPAEVDDVVQETFLVAYRKGGFLDQGAKPTTWLCAIALRVWSTLKRTRRRKREAPLDADSMGATRVDAVFDVTSARESLRRVGAALEALSDDHRAAFILFELDGAPAEDIAQAMQIPVGTIHSRLFNARRRFLEAYSRLAEHRAPPVLPAPRKIAPECAPLSEGTSK